MEFGSDFHKVEYPIGNGLPYGIFNHYVSGRQPLLDVIQMSGYKRVWIPSYYCGESLTILDRCDVKIARYNCLPMDNPDSCVENLPLESDDLLLRFNFFGLHCFHNSDQLPCDVIEDHTHDLIGEWARNSNARWCFASIRKTMPTADGGILWSSINEPLLTQPSLTREVAGVMSIRYRAMEKKSEYLKGKSENKESFLKDFRNTEECFSSFTLSDWSLITNDIAASFDIVTWYKMKKANYVKLISSLEFHYSIPLWSTIDKSTPFSLIILFHNNALRDKARRHLIKNNVYPAILWPDVYDKDAEAVDFSQRMLSIHCDGRYTINDIQLLAQIINEVI